MIDALLDAGRKLAISWQSEADRRRRISPNDPVADTLDYCAGEILTQLGELQQDSTWVGVEDYAELHDVTPQTVRNWIRRGELKSHKSGHGYIIHRNAKRQREVHR